jgi:hypothetical protein
VLLAVLAGGLLAGCTSTTVGKPAPQASAPTAPPTPTATPSEDADRTVCIDLDARGGQLYVTFVVPMMAGPEGPSSVEVDIAQMSRAVAAVAQIDEDAVSAASSGIADQYTSIDFGRTLRTSGVVASMGSIGDAIDNAMAESFFATLKEEMIYRRAWPTRHELEMEDFSFIEGFYNPLLHPLAAPLPTGQPQPRRQRAATHDTD